jgi:hypothetical protein
MPNGVNHHVVYRGLNWFGMHVSVERILPGVEEEVTTVSCCIYFIPVGFV